MAAVGAKDCGCGKNPKPLGRPAPQPKSLIASSGGSGKITHVAKDGTRQEVSDLLAGRAAVARQGGTLDFA